MNNRAPLIFAIVLLLLPVLYVGSYLALVTPGGTFVAYTNSPYTFGLEGKPGYLMPYRGGNAWCKKFYRPLEMIDRKVRPGWVSELHSPDPTEDELRAPPVAPYASP